MPLARSPRATSIHASNLDVNDANKAPRAARWIGRSLADQTIINDLSQPSRLFHANEIRADTARAKATADF